MKTARICTIVLILLGLSARVGFAAAFGFSADGEYILAGQTVVFTLTYEQGTSAAPDELVMELDYDGDFQTEMDRIIENPGGTVTWRPSVTFDSPGYFDAKAWFALRSENGDIIADERLELGTSRNPRRINVARWKFNDEGNLASVESTPAVSPDGTTVYFGSENGNVYAVSAADGIRTGFFSTGGPVASAPAIDLAGNVYFGSEDGSVHRCDSGLNLQWEQRIGGHFFSSPALDEENNRLYIGSTDDHLYALDMANGTIDWKHETGAKIVSSPAVGFDNTVYIGSTDGTLYALNPDGSLKWRFDTPCEIRGSPALDRDGTIYFGTSLFRGEANRDNGLYAVSTTGQKKWFKQNWNGFAAAPVIDDDSGTVVASSWDNNVYGTSRGRGRLTMYKGFEDDVLSAPAMGSQNYLFAGGKDGMFYAMNIDRGTGRTGRNEIWHYKLPRPVAGSSPVIHDGYLYVGTSEIDGDTGSGALYAFWAEKDLDTTDVVPAEDSPWPQFRNNSQNTGKTALRPGTVAPEVAKTSPAPGVREFNTNRRNITAEFSMPMDPESIYRAPGTDGPDDEGYFGFIVEPFDADPEEFEIDWNAEQTVFTLTLPDGESFEDETQYTATIKSRTHAENDSNRRILYDYEWTFEHDPEESHDNSHNRFTCFISSIWVASPLDFVADLW